MAGLRGAAEVLLARERGEIFELTEDHSALIQLLLVAPDKVKVNSELLSAWLPRRLEIAQFGGYERVLVQLEARCRQSNPTRRRSRRRSPSERSRQWSPLRSWALWRSWSRARRSGRARR